MSVRYPERDGVARNRVRETSGPQYSRAAHCYVGIIFISRFNSPRRAFSELIFGENKFFAYDTRPLPATAPYHW